MTKMTLTDLAKELIKNAEYNIRMQSGTANEEYWLGYKDGIQDLLGDISKINVENK